MKETINISVMTDINTGFIVIKDAAGDLVAFTVHESEAARKLMARAECEIKWPSAEDGMKQEILE
jgi:hypothetical protein